MPRYRITFAKTEAMRFTGHLDVHRSWERTFRRAGLPLAYSEGFSPHPRLILAAALPLGCVSDEDLLDAWLTEDVPDEAVASALAEAAPPGLRVVAISRAHPGEPALPTQVGSAVYDVRLENASSVADLPGACAQVLSAESLPRQRRGKDYDLRPLIEALEVEPSGGLRMQLAAREGATGRPEEVLLALNLDPARAFIRRTRLILVGQEGVGAKPLSLPRDQGASPLRAP
ncbi:MAG TPA: TIGR03936 family radical SAM-associated protein [Anaerolineales bacterium]|nr:TIGR03936 family radical SAM-associated protein [Anaerolineales bacterium]